MCRKITWMASFIFIIVFFSAPAFSQPIKDPAVNELMRSSKSINEKISGLKSFVKEGNEEAALALGVIYQLGLGGASKDDVESTKWYKAAAEKGNAHAQYMLGANYAGGIGVTMDLEKAKYWYEKASENGYAEAAESLVELKKNMWLSKTGWVTIQQLCDSGVLDCSNPIMLTSKSFINHWAGQVIEAYHIKGKENFGSYKIRIEWVTDKSPYRCGQIIEKRVDDLKDFTARSLALRRCN